MALGFMVFALILIGRDDPPELRFFTGSLAAVIILVLIFVTGRWNREALANLRRQGPRFNPREQLRTQREQMILRNRDAATREEHTSD